MSIAVAVLLVICVVTTLLSTIGMVRSRDPLVELHYLSPVSTFATTALVLAMALGGASVGLTVKAVIVLVTTALTGPVTQNKIARAIWVRRHGGWTMAARKADEEAR